MVSRIQRLRLNYGQKLFLTATLPLILAVVTISVLVTLQSRQLAEREIKNLEAELIAAKRDELKNYLSIARTAFINIYGRAAPDDEDAQLLVTQILSGMLYGQDGYFFVYDYDGKNLVSPRRTDLIGRNWTGLEDPTGTAVTDELIRRARTGGGYHSYMWPKPSTGETAQIVAYVIGLQDWRWAVGTGHRRLYRRCHRQGERGQGWRGKPYSPHLSVHRCADACRPAAGLHVGHVHQHPRTPPCRCQAQKADPTGV